MLRKREDAPTTSYEKIRTKPCLRVYTVVRTLVQYVPGRGGGSFFFLIESSLGSTLSPVLPISVVGANEVRR